MKLKCKEHSRRVMVLKSGKVIHRNNGTGCNTDLVEIGAVAITIAAILEWK